MFAIVSVCLYVCGWGGVPVKGSVLPMDVFKCVHYEARTRKADGWHSTSVLFF